MAFGNSFHFNIQSFEQLEQIYKDTSPINERIHKTIRDIRPLGSHNQKHARVKKIDDNTYACVFYDTPCVTYHRNGKLEVTTGGWDTQSTTGFVNACMPYGWHAYRIQSRLHVQYGRTVGSTAFYIVGGDMTQPLTISDYRGEVFEVLNAVTPTKRRVHREETKIARAKHQPFLEFARGFMDVLNLDVPRNTDLTWWTQRAFIDEYYKDPSVFAEDKFLDLLSAIVHRGYRPIDFSQLKKMLHIDGTVYERVALPMGSCQKR